MARKDSREVGRTGARFGGRHTSESDPVVPAVEASPAASGLDPVGARFARPERRHALDPAPADRPPEPVAVDEGDPDFAAELEAYAQGGSSQVRPYFFTKGRTRAAVDLALEALVSATPGAAAAGPAQLALELCREPRSVAEIAALLTLPLGVARVLLGDLVEAGAVVVHRTAEASGPDLTLMQRVLTGLRNL